MRRLLTTGGVLAVLALGWFFLAPSNLGGRTTYVVTHGVSMEPKFHTGDLAILYPRANYQVGEIVAYRSATLHTVVMHRIVAASGGTFTFKGDNNSWLDPDHPTKADLLGSLALQVPGGGRYLAVLHSPQGQAVAGGVLALILLAGTGRVRRRRALRTSRGSGTAGKHRAGRHRATTPRVLVVPEHQTVPASASAAASLNHLDAAARFGRTNPRPRMSASARGQIAAAACLVVVCVGGDGWLSQLPASGPATRPVTIDQTGTFEYSAAVPASLVYPQGRVSSGDPIFTQIVDTVDFSFDYAASATTSGTVAMSAALVGPSGWRMPLATGSLAAVKAGRGSASVRVELSTAQAALSQFEAATGLKGAAASLVVTPDLKVTTGVDGHQIQGQFPHSLTFALGAGQLTMIADKTATSVPATPGSEPDDASGAVASPLTISAPQTTTVPSTAPRTLAVLGHRLPVRTARIAAGIGTGVAIGLLIATLIGSRRRGRAEDDVVSALRQYGDRIVSAESIPLEGPVVELTSLAALHSIAERYDRVILHTVRGERHSYVVRDELSWYRYDVRPDRGERGGAHAGARRGAREQSGSPDAAVIRLEPRLRTPDILPGGVGASAWSDGYVRAS